jgi:hypothetical protein
VGIDRRTLGVVLGVATSLVACKPKLQAHATQTDDGVIVVQVTTDADAILTVRDRSCAGPTCELKFAALDFPLGKNTIAVDAKRKGKTTGVDVAFDRKEVAPTIALSTTEPGYIPCTSAFCAKDAKLKVGQDSTMTFQVVGPASAKVTIGSSRATLPVPARFVDQSTAQLKIDLHDWSSVIPLAGIEGTADLFVPIHVLVETDGKREDDLAIPAGWFRPIVHEALVGIEKGPLTLGGEPNAQKTGKSMVVLGKGEDDVWFYGAPSTLVDLDYVGVRKQQPEHQMLKCGPYNGATGSTMVRIVGVDEELTLYDRRTGKTKTTHHFYAAYQACPESVNAAGTGDETQVQRTEVDPKTIASWAKQILALP